jgi:hypothetical protein
LGSHLCLRTSGGRDRSSESNIIKPICWSIVGLLCIWVAVFTGGYPVSCSLSGLGHLRGVGGGGVQHVMCSWAGNDIEAEAAAPTATWY